MSRLDFGSVAHFRATSSQAVRAALFVGTVVVEKIGYPEVIRRLTNEHIRTLLTQIEADGDMTHRLRGRIMNAMHKLSAEVKVEVEIHSRQRLSND